MWFFSFQILKLFLLPSLYLVCNFTHFTHMRQEKLVGFYNPPEQTGQENLQNLRVLSRARWD